MRDVNDSGISLILSRQQGEVLAEWWRNLFFRVLVFLFAVVVTLFLARINQRGQDEVSATAVKYQILTEGVDDVIWTMDAQTLLVQTFPNFVSGVIANLSAENQFDYAKNLYSNASKLMENMMKDVRIGKQVELEQREPVVDNILDSMFSFPSALLPLAQMKNRDEYTFQHSVSVSALAVAFGRVLNMPRAEIRELAMGGMLHDVGKAQVPGHILNKPGKLDDGEFAMMKNHASNTASLLKEAKGISQIAFNAAFGIVREVVPEKLLQPAVQIIYDCKKMCHIPSEKVDLSVSNDKIKSHGSYET